MTKSYADIKKQIETLQRAADTLLSKERASAITVIRDHIARYEITPADLSEAAAAANGAAFKGRQKAAAVKRATPSKPPKPRGNAARERAVSGTTYRNKAGDEWAGRGPRPMWLRKAVAAGKTLASFAT